MTARMHNSKIQEDLDSVFFLAVMNCSLWELLAQNFGLMIIGIRASRDLKRLIT